MRKLFLFLTVFLMIATVSARMEQHAGFPANAGSPIKSLLVVQDINGDGKPEIIAAPDNRMIKVFNYSGVLIWERTGGINLADEARNPLVANISGRLEVISYGNPGYSDGTFYIWDTAGNNIVNITPGKYLLISSPSITKEGIILTGSAPGSSLGSITQATGVYAFDSSGTKLWYLELGKAVNYRAAIPVGDIDGDGIDEAVILTQDINSVNPTDGKIWVIKVNSITGTVLWSRDLGGDARGARFGDFDGQNEIIVTSSSGVYIFDNSGNQIYKFNIKSNLASPAIGDMDGTGVISAAIASNDDKKVYLIRNGIIKDFSSIGRVDSDLALGDINNDGKMEIAAGDSHGNLYIWDNQGNILENKRVTNDMFTSATIADLEGDGNKEIILGNSNGNIYAYTYINEPVDRIPPATTDDVDGQWHNISVTVTLTAEDNESGVAATYYTIDGTEPTTNSPEGTTFSISNEGIYTIKYFSVDIAGNVEGTKTPPNQVKIDKTSPLTTDNANGQWYNSSVEVLLNASDSGSGIMETYYTTDGSIPTSSSLKGTTVSISGDGNHTIMYYSVDNAGNVEQVHTATIRIDNIPPQTVDNSNSAWYTANVTLTITASDNFSGVEAINYIVDGVGQVSYSPNIQLTFNKEGGHTVKYFSLDNAGNAETMKTAVVRITMSLPATMDNSGGKYSNTNSDTTPKLSATDKLQDANPASYSADKDCISCHKIRHGTTGNNCENCHYNTTFSNGKHTEKPFSPGFMHDSFDWEGDNANEKGADRLNESCPVCHVKMTEHTSPKLNVCEDCHVKVNPELSPLANVRPDITKYIPVVYSHYNDSPINVTDQSSLGNTRSSCFGFDAATGQGSCHGVTFGNKEKAGGYFSFNTNYTGTIFNRGDPYHWNSPVDFMPDSKNCIFCHIQENENIKKAWGAPAALPSDSQHSNIGNKDCWGCHVEGELKSFHGKEIVKTVTKPYLTYIAAFSLVIAIVALWFWKKQKK